MREKTGQLWDFLPINIHVYEFPDAKPCLRNFLKIFCSVLENKPSSEINQENHNKHDIPQNFDGTHANPLTFLFQDKNYLNSGISPHNPEQFCISRCFHEIMLGFDANSSTVRERAV